MKRAVIFSGGAFEKPDWVTLPKDAMILCADSGLRHARALGISLDWALGDFDSSSEQPEGESVLRYPPEKDDTDTMLAVKQALSLGAEEIQIYGGLGGRFDHAIANVQTAVSVRAWGSWFTLRCTELDDGADCRNGSSISQTGRLVFLAAVIERYLHRRYHYRGEILLAEWYVARKFSAGNQQ